MPNAEEWVLVRREDVKIMHGALPSNRLRSQRLKKRLRDALAAPKGEVFARLLRKDGTATALLLPTDHHTLTEPHCHYAVFPLSVESSEVELADDQGNSIIEDWSEDE